MSEEERKAAAIDIGSNSCRLLIASKEDGEIKREYFAMKITKLSEGIETEGNATAKLLTEPARQRTFAALQSFKKEIEKQDISRVKAVGTSALREVDNAQDFCRKIENRLSIPVEIISGQQEAKLVLAGVNSFPRRDVQLVIDIGGGSTEIIRQKGKSRVQAVSLKMGAVRFTERYISEPGSLITQNEQNDIVQVVRELLREKASKLDNISSYNDVFGVGGTITSLAAIAEEMEIYNSEIVENYSLSRSRIEKICRMLAGKNLEERKQVPGLQPERADIIVSGILILLAFMKYFDYSRLQVSDRGILYGMISHYLL